MSKRPIQTAAHPPCRIKRTWQTDITEQNNPWPNEVFTRLALGLCGRKAMQLLNERIATQTIWRTRSMRFFPLVSCVKKLHKQNGRKEDWQKKEHGQDNTSRDWATNKRSVCKIATRRSSAANPGNRTVQITKVSPLYSTKENLKSSPELWTEAVRLWCRDPGSAANVEAAQAGCEAMVGSPQIHACWATWNRSEEGALSIPNRNLGFENYQNEQCPRGLGTTCRL